MIERGSAEYFIEKYEKLYIRDYESLKLALQDIWWFKNTIHKTAVREYFFMNEVVYSNPSFLYSVGRNMTLVRRKPKDVIVKTRKFFGGYRETVVEGFDEILIGEEKNNIWETYNEEELKIFIDFWNSLVSEEVEKIKKSKEEQEEAKRQYNEKIKEFNKKVFGSNMKLK